MYVGESFNGVLFLLREPHIDEKTAKEKKEAEEKQDEVKKQEILATIRRGSDEWIKKVLRNSFTEEEWQNMERKDKTAATKYRNRIQEIVASVLGSEADLTQIAYDNLNPQGGGPTTGKEYARALENLKREDFLARFRPLGKNLTYVFTCSDIFKKLQQTPRGTETQKGVCYYRGSQKWVLKSFCYSDEEFGTFTVFEIPHPSRSSEIKGVETRKDR